MSSKKIATVLAGLVAAGMLSACNDQPPDNTINVVLLLSASDWLLLGGALVLLFLVPVIIIYWPKGSPH